MEEGCSPFDRGYTTKFTNLSIEECFSEYIGKRTFFVHYGENFERYYPIYSKEHILLEKKMAEEKVEALQKQKAQLSGDIDKLKTDQGVEDSIREKFGFAKPGEGMIVVVDDKPAPVAPEEKKENGFEAWWKSLFSKN